MSPAVRPLQAWATCVARVAALAVVPLLAGCGGDGGAAAPDGAGSSCAAPAGVPAPAELTGHLDLGDLVDWDAVQVDGGSVNANGVAPGTSLDAVLQEVRDRTADQGWEVFALDDEGFEAEVLARGADDTLLGVTLREGACEGEVQVLLSVTEYDAS